MPAAAIGSGSHLALGALEVLLGYWPDREGTRPRDAIELPGRARCATAVERAILCAARHEVHTNDTVMLHRFGADGHAAGSLQDVLAE